ncbi:unnamed protein product, partial [Ectocarpus sp. 12 AP-2014]
MSWFRGKKEPEPEPTPEPTFSSDTSAFEGTTNFASGPPSRGGGGATSAGMGDLQAAMQVEQQKAQMQAIVSRLTDLAFTKCIQKPSSSLSSSEQSCINATVLKYFDTSEFVLGRLMKS